MTLTVSVRVPDGIVLAADSLTTIETKLIGKGELGLKCPKCNEEIKIPELPLPPVSIPAGGSFYGQKLFCIEKRNIGVATYGTAFLTGRTLESHVREFEKKEIVGEETASEVAQKLEEYFQAELTKEIGDTSKIPDDAVPLGFQVAGYDKEDVKIGKTFLVKLGKTPKIEPTHTSGYGCTIAGDTRVVLKLWKDDPAIPIPKPNYQFLSLQDAIDYAVFLIRTTIDFQKFATMVPTCGGEIDIAIITHHKGLNWIQRKEYRGEKPGMRKHREPYSF
jgi:20S proteasome alpha/beta subunit